MHMQIIYRTYQKIVLHRLKQNTEISGTYIVENLNYGLITYLYR
jgi:hypothetical protein